MIRTSGRYNFTSDAQEDEAFVAGIVVEIFPVAKRLLLVLGRVDFCQKLFGDFGEVSDDVGVTREDDVAAGNDAEQDGHRDAETVRELHTADTQRKTTEW